MVDDGTTFDQYIYQRCVEPELTAGVFICHACQRCAASLIVLLFLTCFRALLHFRY